MYNTNRIRLARKPGEQFQTSDFTEEQLTLAAATEGEAICRVRYISLDPYLAQMMQAWQGPQKDWGEGIIIGRMVGEIIASNDPSLNVGDWVLGDSRWQGIEVRKAKQFTKIHLEEGVPASAFLGVLGSSGLTAWIGVNRVIQPQAGETFTVSSAAGSVGAIAGQLAKQQGARVIGIAGGTAKCKEVVETLGFDACIDHNTEDFEAQLNAAVGSAGIDGHYENVGAKTLDPALALMNDNGRIGLCGLIAHYLNDDAVSLKHFRKLLTSGLSLKGFRVYDYPDDVEEAQKALRAAVKNGEIAIRETISEGLSSAPEAYIKMLSSGGTGKHLLHLCD